MVTLRAQIEWGCREMASPWSKKLQKHPLCKTSLFVINIVYYAKLMKMKL